MLEINYLGHYPEKVFQLPSDLTIYKNSDSTRGVVGGPHKMFTETESKHHMNTTAFLSDQCKLFKAGYQVNLHDLKGAYTSRYDECQERSGTRSIAADTDRRITTALLPPMFNPLHKLAENKGKALPFYN